MSGLLHLLVDILLAFHELFILSLQVLEPVLQCLNVIELFRLSVAPGPRSLILHNGLQEVIELLKLPLFLLLPS